MYGVLVLNPSKEWIESDDSQADLAFVDWDRQYVYDHRSDRVVTFQEYYHRLMGSGPAIMRAAASNDLVQLDMFLSDPSAPSAVRAADGAGHTPLHQAALFGHLQCCKKLLKANASVNVQDHLGFTPLYQASA